MVSIVKVMAAFGFLIGVLILVSLTVTPQQTSNYAKVYNDIVFPNTGDHIIFYQPAQQIAASVAQLSTNPSIPIKFLFYDSHHNVIAQNTTSNQIINATANTSKANQIIAMANSTTSTNGGTYLTQQGVSYSQTTDSVNNPTQTPLCYLGQTCHIMGKIVITDPATCHYQTVNGARQKVCTNLLGPFKYTIQILCVDSNVWRCAAIHDSLPTTKGETKVDGTFDYAWTPLGGTNYVGTYIGRMYAESETLGANGQILDESGDYPLQIIQ